MGGRASSCLAGVVNSLHDCYQKFGLLRGCFMSDLVQDVFKTFPGSQQVGSEGVRSSQSSARRERSCLLRAASDEKVKKKKEGPYGLATGGNNWLESHKITESIKFGLKDEKDIIKDFREMIIRVDGSRSPILVNEAGELILLHGLWNLQKRGWFIFIYYFMVHG